MNQNIFLFLKNISLNNIILVGCLISNTYSNYIQYKKNQEILAIIQEERRNIVELLDKKLEKLNYSFQLWTEKSSVGIEKVKNKISLIQDKMADQHFLLTSNIAQPPKFDSNLKITLFDQMFPSSIFQLIVFGVFVSGCLSLFYFSGYFNPWLYFDFSKFRSFDPTVSKPDKLPTEIIDGVTGKENNMLFNTTQDVVIIDASSSKPFIPSTEDLELINMHISNLFK